MKIIEAFVKEHNKQFLLSEDDIIKMIKNELIKNGHITKDYQLVNEDFRVSNNCFMDLTLDFKKTEYEQ